MFWPLVKPYGWQPARPVPRYASVPSRFALMMGTPVAVRIGRAGAPIEPGYEYFRAGNPIGGPSEGYRGVRAAAYPIMPSVLGAGGPMSSSAVGIAGSPIMQ
ncbi:MAG: hypothetical protein ACM3XM_20720 [Mycobacterium leprae]